MTEKTMKEAQLFGKLLPTHPETLPILKEIREKYQIPAISRQENLLEFILIQ